jgi:TonB family protein
MSGFSTGGEAPSREVFRRRSEDLAIPLKPMETQKRTTADLDKALEKLRQRDASPPQPQPTRAALERQPGQAPAASDTAGGRGKMNAYFAQIRARIKGQWAVPAAIIPKQHMEAIIDVQIVRSGAISHISFEKRSGNRYFDESALKAVRKASPFPPFPEGFPDAVIEVGVVFPSRELH